MNQKRFVSISIIFLVFALVGIGGYFVFVKKPAEQQIIKEFNIGAYKTYQCYGNCSVDDSPEQNFHGINSNCRLACSEKYYNYDALRKVVKNNEDKKKVVILRNAKDEQCDVYVPDKYYTCINNILKNWREEFPYLKDL